MVRDVFVEDGLLASRPERTLEDCSVSVDNAMVTCHTATDGANHRIS